MKNYKRLFAFATLCIGLIPAMTTFSLGAMPDVQGTVYYDADFNGHMNVGEGLAGVSVNLYEDDGDNIFNPSLDAMLTTSITDPTGQYSFAGLSQAAGYFVHQTAQSVSGMNINDSVTQLLINSQHKRTIDEFSDQQRVEANPRRVQHTTNLTSSGVIGGQRDLHVQYHSGPAEAVLYANPYGMANVLDFSQSAGVRAIATVTWDGIDNDMSTTPAVGGLGGLDLTADGAEAFAFSMGIDAAGEGDELVLKIFSGSDVSMATIAIPRTNGTATIPQFVSFNQFIGAADLTSVDAIQLQLAGDRPSIDAQIGPISTVGPVQGNISVSTPEPSAMLMSMFAVLWVFGAARKRRTA